MTALFYWTGACVWAVWVGFAALVLLGEAYRTLQARRRIRRAVRELIESGTWEWSAK